MAKDKDLSINRRIAQQRRAMGLTQAKVAEKLGMKTSTYSQMERSGNISAVKLEKIAIILETDLETLIGKGSIPKEPTKNNKIDLILKLANNLNHNEQEILLQCMVDIFSK